MCTSLVLLESDRLILAHNRDEFLDRPTEPLGWWETSGQPIEDQSTEARYRILSGRDQRAGGTWLALSPAGDLSWVTNVRTGQPDQGRRSRGQLPLVGVIEGAKASIDFASAHASGYSPFNYLAFDRKRFELKAVHSFRPEPQILAPGVHGISNGQINEAWPKVERVREAARDWQGQPIDPETWVQIMLDETKAPESRLPSTGVPTEVEAQLSSPFVRMPGYGTRTTSLIVLTRQGFHWWDWSWDATREGRPKAVQVQEFAGQF